SDVCSSDLQALQGQRHGRRAQVRPFALRPRRGDLRGGPGLSSGRCRGIHTAERASAALATDESSALEQTANNHALVSALKKKKKLWGGRFTSSTAGSVEAFT